METWINRNLLCNRYQRNQLLVYNYLARIWLLFIINRFLEFSVRQVWLPDKQHQQFPRKLARNANSQVWHQITSWTGNAEVGTSNLYFNKSSGFPGGSAMKVASLGHEDPPEEGMATHSSILACRIPWAEQPGRLQSMGLQSARHNWVINTVHKVDSEVRETLRSIVLRNLWLHRAAHRISDPWPGIEPIPLAVEAPGKSQRCTVLIYVLPLKR